MAGRMNGSPAGRGEGAAPPDAPPPLRYWRCEGFCKGSFGRRTPPSDGCCIGCGLGPLREITKAEHEAPDETARASAPEEWIPTDWLPAVKDVLQAVRRYGPSDTYGETSAAIFSILARLAALRPAEGEASSLPDRALSTERADVERRIEVAAHEIVGPATVSSAGRPDQHRLSDAIRVAAEERDRVRGILRRLIHGPTEGATTGSSQE